jgi:hypothetical protein
MPHLIEFQNSKIPQPENGSSENRLWTGYPSEVDNLLYEILYAIING